MISIDIILPQCSKLCYIIGSGGSLTLSSLTYFLNKLACSSFSSPSPLSSHKRSQGWISANRYTVSAVLLHVPGGPKPLSAKERETILAHRQLITSKGRLTQFCRSIIIKSDAQGHSNVPSKPKMLHSLAHRQPSCTFQDSFHNF